MAPASSLPSYPTCLVQGWTITTTTLTHQFQIKIGFAVYTVAYLALFLWEHLGVSPASTSALVELDGKHVLLLCLLPVREPLVVFHPVSSPLLANTGLLWRLHAVFEYDSAPGILIALLHVGLLFVFLWLIRGTYKFEHEKAQPDGEKIKFLLGFG